MDVPGSGVVTEGLVAPTRASTCAGLGWLDQPDPCRTVTETANATWEELGARHSSPVVTPFIARRICPRREEAFERRKACPLGGPVVRSVREWRRQTPRKA